MGTKIASASFLCLILVTSVYGQPSSQEHSPVQLFKDYALTTCIANGLQSGKAAEYAAAAAREYFEHGGLPIEAHTEAELLGQKFLAKEYKNIYGDNLVFIKCIDFYHSTELDRLTKKYVRKK